MLTVGASTNTVFNPHDKPEEELPTIFGFVNGQAMMNWLDVVALSEDGICLGGHICSHECFGPGDIGCLPGVRTDRHEKQYQKYYPDGYRMEWVQSDQIEGHSKLQEAIQASKDLTDEEVRAKVIAAGLLEDDGKPKVEITTADDEGNEATVSLTGKPPESSTLKRTYVTFGQSHTHRVNNKTFDADCVAVIDAESYDAGRKKAEEYFGLQFCTTHTDQDWTPAKASFYPRGCIPVE